MIKEIFPTPIYIGEASLQEQKEISEEIKNTLDFILTPPRKGQYLTKGNPHFKTVNDNSIDVDLSDKKLGVWYSDIRRVWDQECIDGTTQPPIEPLWVNREDVITDLDMIDCKKFIFKHVDEYMSNTKWGVHKTKKYKKVIDSSHINYFEPFSDKNHYQNIQHRHLEADIACVYYVNVTEKTGDFVFNQFTNFHHEKQFPMGSEYSPEFRIRPKNGMVLIFPATLSHKFYPNNDTENKRISLVVNIRYDINEKNA